MKKLPSNGEIRSLTGVRGIAAVWVVLFHAYPTFAPVSGFPDRKAVPLIDNGFLGVDLFFILSGLIMSYVHSADFGMYEWREHKRFLMLRTCRVYPLHLVCLILFCTLIFALPGALSLYHASELTPSGLAATVLLVQNWGVGPFSSWNSPTWSLSAELLGYFMFPFIIVAIRRYLRPAWELPAICVLLSLFLTVLSLNNYPTLDAVGKMGIVRMITEFTVGCLIYRVLDTSAARFSSELVFWLSIAIVSGAVLFKFNFIAVFGLALLVAALAVPSASGNLVFANPLSAWLGKISFALYLCHIPVLTVFSWQRKTIGSTWSLETEMCVAVATLVVTLLLSHLLWRFVEMPSRTYLRRFIPHRTRVNLTETHLAELQQVTK